MLIIESIVGADDQALWKEQRKEESKLQQRGVSDPWKEFNGGFATQFDNDE